MSPQITFSLPSDLHLFTLFFLSPYVRNQYLQLPSVYIIVKQLVDPPGDGIMRMMKRKSEEKEKVI